MTLVPPRAPHRTARRYARLLGTLILVCAPSHSITANPRQPAAAQAPQALHAPPIEALAIEDTVARAFEQHRIQTRLRALTRIPDRPLLRQLTCTAAVTGHPPMTPLSLESQADDALVLITDSSLLHPALARVADYDDRRTASGRHVRRYSIAAFTSPTQPGQTWVGIALYWGRLTEWLATRSGTYTHAVAARAVDPACVDVR